MREHKIVAAILQLLALGAAQEYQFLKWTSPGANLAANDVSRRQSPPPGYHPEFGSCGSGTTCENACGQNWISCQASTNLSLFCYNKVDLGQTCCENGSGRACERGYYCAWQEFGGKVWCCEDGQSLEECGVPTTSSSSGSFTSSTSSLTASSGGPSSSGGPRSSTSSTSESSTPSTTSGTGTNSGPSSTSDGECGTKATVTSWATTTVLSTVSFAVTVTERGEGCTSPSHSGPSGSTSVPSTITQPPSSTSKTPPVHNTTSTTSLVTGGAGALRVDVWTVAILLVGLVWL